MEKSSSSHSQAKAKKPTYSNIDKGMNWWNFNIKKMTVGQRYFYIGLIIVVPSLIGFFLGLSIDFSMSSAAFMAYVVMAFCLGASCVIAYNELKKII